MAITEHRRGVAKATGKLRGGGKLMNVKILWSEDQLNIITRSENILQQGAL
jgi:hypothetical protein